MRKVWLIFRTVLLESIRRKEIYAIVLLSTILIAVVGSIKFFQIEGLGKFFREIALKIMNLSTALTVIVLSSRQLPREFENRTIYPLLAKPVSRDVFLLSKFLGVIFAGVFCYFLFSLLFFAGNLYLKAKVNWLVFFQGFYLQMLMLSVLGSLCFVLSLILHLDAAITIATLLYLLGQIYSVVVSTLYDYFNSFGKGILLLMNYLIPQLTLFDLSAKIVHSELWGPIPFWAIQGLTIYALVYILFFLCISYILFRKREL